jgi:hypothetical protein
MRKKKKKKKKKRKRRESIEGRAKVERKIYFLYVRSESKVLQSGLWGSAGALGTCCCVQNGREKEKKKEERKKQKRVEFNPTRGRNHHSTSQGFIH